MWPCSYVFIDAAPNDTSSTVKPKTFHVTNSILILVKFPIGINCESIQVCNYVTIYAYCVYFKSVITAN